MCGILAIARGEPSPHPLATDRGLAAAMSRLRRRGPDGEGIATVAGGRVLLGHTRLAIQDRSDAGRQPMGDAADPASSHVVITFNGEIYNAPALRRELEREGFSFRSRTDTEVLLHGFRHWGFEALLPRLCGMFAFVLIDRRDSGPPVLYSAVDPAGMKPLVWSHQRAQSGRPDRLTLASDCDALLALCDDDPGFERRIDGDSLCHVLSIGYCPPPRTVWRGVHKLGPGGTLVWRMAPGETPRIGRHWRPPDSITDAPRGDDQRDFAHLFRSVVDDHLLSDVPVGVFLSAGLDSTSVALALAQLGHTSDVSAWSLSSDAVDQAFDEAPLAAATASAMIMRHRTIRFEHGDLAQTLALAAEAYDEPQGFSALLTAVRIAERTRRGEHHAPTVILAGDGGDESFAGYSWHSSAPHALSLDPRFAPPIGPTAKSVVEHERDLARRVADPACAAADRHSAWLLLAQQSYAHRYLCRVFPGFHPAESRSLLRALEPEYDSAMFADWLAPEDRPDLPHPRRAQRLDMMGFCAGSILPKIDRAAMHVALELRAPFLDRRVLDWSLPRPVEPEELLPGRSKPLLRRVLREAVRAGLLPTSILERPKQGFSLRLAADRPFETLAAGMLPNSRLIRDGVIRPDYAAFPPIDPAAREVRMFTLCMIAAWYEHRAS